jgi:hypothetical protein
MRTCLVSNNQRREFNIDDPSLVVAFEVPPELGQDQPA